MFALPYLTKPRFGERCNGCGLCCSLALCEVGKIAFPKGSAPCPGLRYTSDKSRSYCALIATEIENNLEPLIQRALGVGVGCTADDP